MAVQADRKPPESPAKIQRIYDFSGGLNTTINGSLLNTNEAQVAKNVAFEQKGTLVPLKGRRKRYSSPFAVEAISGMGMLYKQDGTSRIVIASGSSMYADKPNLSMKWDSKSDFEQTGTQKTSFVDLDTVNGSMQLKRNYLARATADCTSVTPFSAINTTLAIDSTIKVYNLTSLKVALATGATSGKARITPTFDITSPACFAVKVYNGNLSSGLRISALPVDGITAIKTSAYSTTVGWTTLFIKLSTTDLQTLSYLAIELSGSATQYGYVDGIVFYPITQTDYDNAGYVPLDFNSFEPSNDSIVVDTSAQFNEGTLTDCITSGGVLSCDIGESKSQTVDIFSGDKTNISVISTGITVDTGLTWVPYAGMTFDALIAL